MDPLLVAAIAVWLVAVAGVVALCRHAARGDAAARTVVDDVVVARIPRARGEHAEPERATLPRAAER